MQSEIYPGSVSRKAWPRHLHSARREFLKLTKTLGWSAWIEFHRPRVVLKCKAKDSLIGPVTVPAEKLDVAEIRRLVALFKQGLRLHRAAIIAAHRRNRRRAAMAKSGWREKVDPLGFFSAQHRRGLKQMATKKQGKK